MDRTSEELVLASLFAPQTSLGLLRPTNRVNPGEMCSVTRKDPRKVLFTVAVHLRVCIFDCAAAALEASAREAAATAFFFCSLFPRKQRNLRDNYTPPEPVQQQTLFVFNELIALHSLSIYNLPFWTYSSSALTDPGLTVCAPAFLAARAAAEQLLSPFPPPPFFLCLP